MPCDSAAQSKDAASFALASKALSEVEKSRLMTAEEEQELIEDAPQIGIPRVCGPTAADAAACVRKYGLVQLDGLLTKDEACRLSVHCNALVGDAYDSVIEASAEINGGASEENLAAAQSKYLELFGPSVAASVTTSTTVPVTVFTTAPVKFSVTATVFASVPVSATIS